MTYLRRVLLIALVLLLVAVPAMAQQGGRAVFRFVHAIPGASGIDIYTDGQLTVSNLTYGSATPYINASSGGHHIAVTQTNGDTSLWEQDIDADRMVPSTAAASAWKYSNHQDIPPALLLAAAR
ncbi:MAG: DUF4397 domain-containing protein [Anaerolineae bacterium]